MGDVLAALFADWLSLDLLARAAVAALMLALPVGWLAETIRYAALQGSTDRIHLAPVHVHGPLLEAMGRQGVALALQGELSAITRARRMLDDRPAPYVAPATARDQGYYLVGLRQAPPIPTRVTEALGLPRVEQEIVIKVGPVTLPVSDIMNMVLVMLGAVFVPFRGTYRRALIHVSLVAHGEQTRLTVHLPGRYAARYPRWWETTFRFAIPLARAYLRRALREPPWPPLGARLQHWSDRLEPRAATEAPPIVHTVTRATANLTDVADLLRDAAFMVLAIHEHDRREWRAMRSLLDGLDALGEYRKNGDAAAQSRARAAFREAAITDPLGNPHAVYFHGVMTMVDRTAEAIDEALLHFHTGLDRAEDRRLEALIHTGMAYCHAQQVHRLATPSARTLALAHDHARSAEAAWRAAIDAGELPPGTPPHPLIPYTYGLVNGVDERVEPDRDGYGREERLLRAARFYYRAVELDPRNGMFYNNLGWALLKLTEWHVPAVPFEVTLETLLSRLTPRASRLSVSAWSAVDDWGQLPPMVITTRVASAVASEGFLRYAAQLQPNNKLTHANLALVYSTSYFRDRDASAYLMRARFHGRRAVQLDGAYVNGYRDLAIALIRYGQLDEAKTLYDQALELADNPEKDQELIQQISAEVETAGTAITAEELATWRHPRTALLEPRSPTGPTVDPEPRR